MRRQAFTLIEILVVVAIISLIAAILFPVFSRARESARRTSCMSNQKQIGLAFMQYAQDNDETYAPSYLVTTATPPDGIFWSTGVWFWQQIIYPYVKSTAVFVCPNRARGFDATPYRGSYGANQLLISGGTPGGSASAMALSVAKVYKLSQLQRASEIYMTMDYGGYDPHPTYVIRKNSAGTFVENTWRYLPGATSYDPSIGCRTSGTEYWDDCMSQGRHFDGVTIAFADGHAKFVRSSVVVDEARKWNSTTHAGSAWDPES